MSVFSMPQVLKQRVVCLGGEENQDMVKATESAFVSV